MIIPDILLIIISLVALIFASITDLKIKEVPDWLSYGLISSGLAIRLLSSIILENFSYFYYGLIGLAIMFVIGEILYHTKMWGGGDAKLLMGLGTTLATTPFYLESSTIPFLAILFAFILFSGVIYGLIWSIFLVIKKPKNFITEFKKISHTEGSKIIKILSLVIIALLIVGIILVPISNLTRLFIGLFIIIFLIYPYLFIAVKAIENIHFYTYLPLEKIVEGDWIAKDIKKNNKVVFKQKITITNKDIKHLKELNIKRILVKDGIPFVPPFLIGTILALIIGNPLI